MGNQNFVEEVKTKFCTIIKWKFKCN